MRVTDILSPLPRMVKPDDTLVFAVKLMQRGGYRHLLVGDESDLIGVISAGDIAQHQSRTGESIYANPSDTVAMAMTLNPETAAPGEELGDVSRRMAEGKFGCLPVVRHGKVIGIITTTDVLAGCAVANVPRRATYALVNRTMTRNPRTINQDDSLMAAATLMQAHGLRHLPVVDEADRAVGMISDRDLRCAFGDPGVAVVDHLSTDERMKVRDWMSSPAITVEPQDSCLHAAQLLATRHIGALPVVNSGRRVIGIISYVDVLRALPLPEVGETRTSQPEHAGQIDYEE